MKNPFKLSEQILKYLQGDLNEDEIHHLEKLISVDKNVRKLVEDIQDKENIAKELEFMSHFDTEVALHKVKSSRRINRFYFLRYLTAAVIVFSFE